MRNLKHLTSSPVSIGLLTAVPLSIVLSSIASFDGLAQVPASGPPTPQVSSPAELEAAGVQLRFDVVSVRPNLSDAAPYSRFPLGPGDAYISDVGFFLATNQPLIAYLRFALKLGQTDLRGLPARGIRRAV